MRRQDGELDGLAEMLDSQVVAAVHRAADAWTGTRTDHTSSAEAWREHYLATVRLAHAAGLPVDGWIANARRFGASWSDAGALLGTSRQAAFERYRDGFPDDPPPAGGNDDAVASRGIPSNRRVLETLLAGYAAAAADRILRDRPVRGRWIHPGDDTGWVIAWLWGSGRPGQLMLFLADLVGELREHRPDAPDPKLRLDDLLDGLDWAMPPGFDGAELAALVARARAEVPSFYGSDPNA